ncbi:hypothetical protein ACQPW3_11325 [Actinosynnema sp. CA-248983]
MGRRFQRDGSIDDLDRAIALNTRLTEQPVGSRQVRAAALANLGVDLLWRHDLLGVDADLDRAAEVLVQAVETVPPGSPDRARHLTSLGNALSRRAGRTGTRADADHAVQTLQAAVDATPAEAFERANRLNNLGLGQLRRYGITGRLKHLDEAVDTLDAGLRATSADAPGYAWRAGNLAHALELRTRRTGRRDDLDRGRALLRESAERSLTVSVEAALKAAVVWAEWAADRDDWPEAAQAYLVGVEASERLFRTQLSRGHKETWLRAAADLFPETAHALLRAGDPTAAVTVLELGRARMLSEAIDRDRTDLANLPTPSLRDRYLAAATRLRELEAETLPS